MPLDKGKIISPTNDEWLSLGKTSGIHDRKGKRY